MTMAFAATVSLFDIGPIDLVTGKIAEERGMLIAQYADVVVDVHPQGWKGTFLTHLPLQLGGHYWIETAARTTARITVTAATSTENSFDGVGTCPFPEDG
jgi:hypothetical protein